VTTCTHKFIKIINFQLVIKLNCQTQDTQSAYQKYIDNQNIDEIELQNLDLEVDKMKDLHANIVNLWESFRCKKRGEEVVVHKDTKQELMVEEQKSNILVQLSIFNNKKSEENLFQEKKSFQTNLIKKRA
jgi:hypothetical protein